MEIETEERDIQQNERVGMETERERARATNGRQNDRVENERWRTGGEEKSRETDWRCHR